MRLIRSDAGVPNTSKHYASLHFLPSSSHLSSFLLSHPHSLSFSFFRLLLFNLLNFASCYWFLKAVFLSSVPFVSLCSSVSLFLYSYSSLILPLFSLLIIPMSDCLVHRTFPPCSFFKRLFPLHSYTPYLCILFSLIFQNTISLSTRFSKLTFLHSLNHY